MIVWNGNRTELNGVTLRYSLFTEQRSAPGDFVIWKTPEMIDRLAATLGEVAPRTIVELGIAQGGSAVLMNELCQPDRLVTLDRRAADEGPEALHQYIAERSLEQVIRPVYGVNQADAEGLREAVDREAGTGPIDLVIDDASHQLDNTRISFNVLFPRLRPGGRYLIEDWTWGHRNARPTDERQRELARLHYWPSGPPLSVIAFELIMLFGSHPGVIAGVTVDEATITVERGDAPLPGDPFALETSFNPGGLRIEFDDPGGAPSP